MTLTFRPATEAERAEWKRRENAWLTEQAWDLWRRYLCAETRRAPDGEHPWMLHVEEAHAYIRCQYECGARLLDDDDVFVNVSVPVTVDIRGVSGWTEYGTEYDVEVDIEVDRERLTR